MVVGCLSEKIDLSVGKSVYNTLKIVCYLEVGHIFTQIFFPLVIIDNLEFFNFHSSFLKDARHDILDEGCECLLVEVTSDGKMESMAR